MFIVDPAHLALAFAVTFVAATVQGTVGFGFAVISVPTLSLLDGRLAPVPQLLLSVPMCVWMAWRERRAVKLAEVGWILVGRLPGAGVGLLLLMYLSPAWLEAMIAGVVFCAVLVLATGREVRRLWWTKFLVGMVAAVFSMVASIGGPPMALLYRNAKGETLRANLAAVFVVGLFITVSARWSTGALIWRDFVLACWLVPAVLLGVYVSGPLGERIEGEPLRRAVLGVSTLAAIGLLARAVL